MSNTPLKDGVLTGAAVVKPSASLTIQGSLVMDTGSTLSLLDNSVGWGKVSKSGSSIADLATRNASDITNTPSGGIVATNVQAALNELDSEISAGGQTLIAYVTNAEATSITRGQVVYLFGASGDRATVKLASNSSESTSSKTFGVVKDASIAANGQGYVICQGVLEGVNLGAFTAGQTVYLGATAGSFTATKPSAPAHLVYVGIVQRANSGNGMLYVKVQNGYELDEIHDVAISSPTTGQTLVYNAVTGLWNNSNTLTLSGSTINSSAIGASNPSTGAFTTLNASSLTLSSTTASTSTTTGALVVTGGVGIGGAANVGGNLTVSGTGTSSFAGKLTQSPTLNANGDNGVFWSPTITPLSGNIYINRSYATINAGASAGGTIGEFTASSVNSGTSNICSIEAFAAIGGNGAASGTMTSYIGFRSSPANLSTGSVSNVYGFRAQNVYNPSGYVGNQYGVYVDALTGAASNYAFYSAGTAPSVLGGNLTVSGGQTSVTGSASAIFLASTTAADSTSYIAFTPQSGTGKSFSVGAGGPSASVDAGALANKWFIRNNSTGTRPMLIDGTTDAVTLAGNLTVSGGNIYGSSTGFVFRNASSGVLGTWDQLGNLTVLGTGTSSMTGRLDIANSVSENTAFQAVNSSATGYGALILGGDSTRYCFKVISQAGAVMINTLSTGTTLGGNLTVTGTAALGTATPNANVALNIANTGTDFTIKVVNASAVSSNGLAVITKGTSASDYALFVKSNDGSNTVLTANNAGNATLGGNLTVNTGNISAAASTDLTLASGGYGYTINIGGGTAGAVKITGVNATPATLADIAAHPYYYNRIHGRAGSSGAVWFTDNLGSTTSLQAATDTANAAQPLVLQPFGGNLLLGTTTDTGEKLQVNGDATFAGSLGIGTTPSYKLHILTTGNNGALINNGTNQLYFGNTGGNPVVGTLTNHDFYIVRNGSAVATFEASNATFAGTGVNQFAGNLNIKGALAAHQTATLNLAYEGSSVSQLVAYGADASTLGQLNVVLRKAGTGTGAVTGLSVRDTGIITQGGVANTPASASATGAAGTISWDASYIYVCTATNTWKRAAIATW